MRTVVPGLWGTALVMRVFTANVLSVAGFSAALHAMFVPAVGTSTMAADVSTGLADIFRQNIPEDNPSRCVSCRSSRRDRPRP